MGRDSGRAGREGIAYFTANVLFWCRKCGDLEEELRNVTNNLKSLEAASEKVGLRGTCYIVFCSQSTALAAQVLAAGFCWWELY